MKSSAFERAIPGRGAWFGAAPALVACVLALGWSCPAQPQKLAGWTFDDAPGTADAGMGRDAPFGARGRALRPQATGTGKVLEFPETARGLVPTAAAYRFWFRPAWTTGAGGGPGGQATLLAIGDRASAASAGWLEWTVNAEGSRLELATGGRGGEVQTWETQPLTFRADHWSELVLNVFPDRVWAFKDGTNVLVRPGGPRGELSQAAVRAGLVVGSRRDGSQPVRGDLDEIEIFDGPLDRVEAWKRGRVLAASPLASGDGLRIDWRLRAGLEVGVERRSMGDTNWASLGHVRERESFEDRTASRGVGYEYRLMTNGVATGLRGTFGWDLPPVEHRGTFLLLVDETLAGDLETSLDRFERNLVGDGWRVVRRLAPRHDDREWRRNTNAVVAVREGIRRDWEASGGAVRSLLLVGHVVIPYAGMRAEDLHTGRGDNHFGAWPADTYYADVDGLWTDKEPYPTYLAGTLLSVTHNVPGDGKWDTEWVPANAAGEHKLEMSFGRLDFANMPSLGRGRAAEVGVIRRYLEKTHRYRHGGMKVEARAVSGPYLGVYSDTELFPTAMRTSRLFGFGEEAIFEGDLFRLPEGRSAAWGFQSGGGKIDRVRDGTHGMVTTAMLASGKVQPRVSFTMLLGSWFGDWAAGEDNLLRAIVASKDHGLAAIWARYTEWIVDPMARGGTLGDAQLLTANESVRYQDPNRGTSRTLTIHGDPSLRLHTVSPPRRVRGERSGASVRLRWDGSGMEAGDGWYVYRSAAGWRGPYERLAILDDGVAEYRDDAAVAGTSYLIRRAQRVLTGSGSYTNLSQGVYWPAPSSGD